MTTNHDQCKAFDASGTVRCDLSTLEDEEHHQPHLHHGTNIDDNEVRWGGMYDDEEGKGLVTWVRIDGMNVYSASAAEFEDGDGDPIMAELRYTTQVNDVIQTLKFEKQEIAYYVETWVCTERKAVVVEESGKIRQLREGMDW